ncbi:MAG TPA: hypothetical protein V6D26_09775 [Stenomitos sp.]
MNHKTRHEITSVIHVLITNLTGVIAEIVEQALQQQPDIELLGNVEGWEAVTTAVAKADVLLLGADNVYSPPEDCIWLLSNYPNLKILVLMPNRDEVLAYWRALYCRQLQVISSQTLIESIRQIHRLSPF